MQLAACMQDRFASIGNFTLADAATPAVLPVIPVELFRNPRNRISAKSGGLIAPGLSSA